ncbi:MAG: glycerol-3-phosphate dehydrogenase/oxidase [Caulobacteraceae bacterium]|nr:glycerol-3-phosphate dehydrogenase/oxidase [Caulobacteraceae bacterium]
MADPGAALDLRDRDALFDALEARVFDLAVIGGGITGAGVARDAAMRGLSVALVEARDFASGTSSRSSKMIHGGLRYLAQGDLALVREAASERKIVRAIAPHLARQTPFVIPARSAGAMAKLRAGLWTFEKLGGVARDHRHEVWSKADLKNREPAVATGDLAGAVVYPEYLTDDARLTLANVRSAAAHGGVVVNYAAVGAIVIEDGRATGLEVAETLPGAGERRARLRARMIVNAAGPWVDVVRAMEAADAPTRLTLTRGIHLVVPRARLPIERTVILTAADRRGVFAVPKGEMAYLGTTDTFEAEPSAWPAITVEDADYLFAAAAARFSTPPLTRADVTSAWSGVRPLVGEEGKKASDISRRDELMTGPAGVLSIAGGKLTAYRKMAERVVDHVQDALGQKRTASRTAGEPLVGGEVAPETLRAALLIKGLAPGDADRLIGLYGAEAPEIAVAGAGPAAEAVHAVLSEGALTLEDYWVRRSARAWFDPDGGLAALPPAAAAMAPLLGWSEARTAEEVTGCRRRHGAAVAALHSG